MWLLTRNIESLEETFTALLLLFTVTFIFGEWNDKNLVSAPGLMGHTQILWRLAILVAGFIFVTTRSL